MWLLASAWGVEEISLRLHPERRVPAEVEVLYRDWLARRAEGEPAHHLTESCSFFGRRFEISPAVLVPRPETEFAVSVALELPLSDDARVLDVGTGSGCIAITVDAERPSWRVAAVDRSPMALRVAARNIIRHDSDVSLWMGDLTAAVGPPWDLVVANLPYIPRTALGGLPLEVQRDPTMALDGGEDGLELVARLIRELPRLLRVCGGAVLELGDDQADRVVEIAAAAGLGVARRVRDLNGTDRVVVLQPR
jgi:release factor glutamine methyltransferase